VPADKSVNANISGMRARAAIAAKHLTSALGDLKYSILAEGGLADEKIPSPLPLQK
jgi:hypothetical protein